MSFSMHLVYNTSNLVDFNHNETQMVWAKKLKSIIISVMFKTWAC